MAPTTHISCTFLWGVQRAVGRMLIIADDIKLATHRRLTARVACRGAHA